MLSHLKRDFVHLNFSLAAPLHGQLLPSCSLPPLPLPWVLPLLPPRRECQREGGVEPATEAAESPFDRISISLEFRFFYWHRWLKWPEKLRRCTLQQKKTWLNLIWASIKSDLEWLLYITSIALMGWVNTKKSCRSWHRELLLELTMMIQRKRMVRAFTKAARNADSVDGWEFSKKGI